MSEHAYIPCQCEGCFGSPNARCVLCHGPHKPQDLCPDCKQPWDKHTPHTSDSWLQNCPAQKGRAAMSERVSDGLLKDVIDHDYRHPFTVVLTARELLALRASHKALYEALEKHFALGEPNRFQFEPWSTWQKRVAIWNQARAAFATAKQLQGAAVAIQTEERK